MEIANQYEKLNSLVWQFRSEMERNCDWEKDRQCFNGTCQDYAQRLAELLISHGFEALAVDGEYLDVDDGYVPAYPIDWGEVDPDEDLMVTSGEWRHWWVVIGDTIAEVTSDQFHPGEEEHHRMVITGKSDWRYSANTRV